MKLSDVVSHLQLPLFAEVPLIIFFVLFVGVALHVWIGKEHFEALRQLPLDEDQSSATRVQTPGAKP